jgi:hypothetical protein
MISMTKTSNANLSSRLAKRRVSFSLFSRPRRSKRTGVPRQEGATLITELGSANFGTAVSARFGNLAGDAEVAPDAAALLFSPSAPFDVVAGASLELAVFCAPSIRA